MLLAVSRSASTGRSSLQCFGSFLMLWLGMSTACSRHPDELRRVRISTYTQGSLTALPMLLAERLGYFKSEGLSVTIEETASGSKAIQALLGGSAEVASAFYELTVQMAVQGRELTSFVSMVRYPGYALVPSSARPKKIHGIEDLAGARSRSPLRGHQPTCL